MGRCSPDARVQQGLHRRARGHEPDAARPGGERHDDPVLIGGRRQAAGADKYSWINASGTRSWIFGTLIAIAAWAVLAALFRRYAYVDRSNPSEYEKLLQGYESCAPGSTPRARGAGGPAVVVARAAIERDKRRAIHRTTFTPNERVAIIASQDELRDRVAVRLLLDDGLRKGARRAVQLISARLRLR